MSDLKQSGLNSLASRFTGGLVQAAKMLDAEIANAKLADNWAAYCLAEYAKLVSGAHEIACRVHRLRENAGQSCSAGPPSPPEGK